MLSPGRVFGWIYTQLRAMSKVEWAVIAVIIALLIALVPPTPHWREIFYRSCHLCGNRQATTFHYRWWRLDHRTTEQLGTRYAADEGHVHDWWQYGHSHLSYSTSWAASKSARYRDGRYGWTPEQGPPAED